MPTYLINRYLKELPVIDLNGVERKFLNGVGFGMDALACEMAEQDEADGKSTNFKVLARKAVFQYKPGKVVVTVDGKTHSYEKAWFIAIMNGKSLWGNIPVAPGQNRLDKRKRLTVVVIHDIGRLKMLYLFGPTIARMVLWHSGSWFYQESPILQMALLQEPFI